MKRSENWSIVETDLNKLSLTPKNKLLLQWAKLQVLLNPLQEEGYNPLQTCFYLCPDRDNLSKINDNNFCSNLLRNFGIKHWIKI